MQICSGVDEKLLNFLSGSTLQTSEEWCALCEMFQKTIIENQIGKKMFLDLYLEDVRTQQTTNRYIEGDAAAERPSISRSCQIIELCLFKCVTESTPESRFWTAQVLLDRKPVWNLFWVAAMGR